MQGGERCEECGSRHWYSEDALRYCRNGHRLEGYAPHEAGEDEYGTTGKVHKKKKEKRQRAAVKLEGAAGRELYLECLQIILRKQIWWLIKERGLPAELEEIVRAFWGLRVRDLPATDDDFPGGDSTFGASDADAKNGELSDGPVDTSRLWRPQKGKRVNLPMLIDTLALCYLGCCTLRLPISTATFCRWAQSEDLEFLIAVSDCASHIWQCLSLTRLCRLMVCLKMSETACRPPITIHCRSGITSPQDTFNLQCKSWPFRSTPTTRSNYHP